MSHVERGEGRGERERERERENKVSCVSFLQLGSQIQYFPLLPLSERLAEGAIFLLYTELKRLRTWKRIVKIQKLTNKRKRWVRTFTNPYFSVKNSMTMLLTELVVNEYLQSLHSDQHVINHSSPVQLKFKIEYVC